MRIRYLTSSKKNDRQALGLDLWETGNLHLLSVGFIRNIHGYVVVESSWVYGRAEISIVSSGCLGL